MVAREVKEDGMYLTDYYRFEHKPGSAKTRLDCVASTEEYEEFERRRCRKVTKTTKPGDLIIYCNDAYKIDNFNADARRRTDKSLTIGSENISGIYTFRPDSSTGFGDFQGTQDALLFKFENFRAIGISEATGVVIEVFVARGLRYSQNMLYNLMESGELDEEINTLRDKARAEKVPGCK